MKLMRHVIHFLKQSRPVQQFVFSLFFPYTASPHEFLPWMDLEVAKAFTNSCPAKCQDFCTSACFQFPTLFAKHIHPMPAGDSSCIVDTDCSGE